MTALRHASRGGAIAALRSRAERWLLDPPGAGSEAERPAHARRLPAIAGLSPTSSEPPRPIVAVVGLGRRVGGSTIARALAVRLARAGPDGVAILFSAAGPRRPLVPNARAAPLAQRLDAIGIDGVIAAGRLCLVAASEPLAPVAAERLAPIVVDVRHGDAAEPALAVADHVTLVASPEVEPSLAATVERSIRGGGGGVTLVANRSIDAGGDARAVPVGESPVAARAALLGLGPRGPFAAPIAELAERCLAEAPR